MYYRTAHLHVSTQLLHFLNMFPIQIVCDLREELWDDICKVMSGNLVGLEMSGILVVKRIKLISVILIECINKQKKNVSSL